MCDLPKDQDKMLDIAELAIEDHARLVERLANPGGVVLLASGSWTVAVFMVADDTLRPYAERDLQELAKTGSPNLQVLVQVHWERGWRGDLRPIAAGGPQFRKPPAPPPGPSSPPVAFSSMEAEFANFLATVSASVAAFATVNPPHHLMIVLWGHAHDMNFSGFGVNGLTIQQIRNRLTASGVTIDILGFDACETSSVEVATVLQGVADRIIGSQIGVPFSGWPYHLILNEVAKNPGIPVDAFGEAILAHFYESYRPPRVTLTMVNGRAAYAGLSAEIGTLVNTIGAHVQTDAALFPALRDVFLIAKRDRTVPIMDLRDFCEQLVSGLAASPVAAAVTTALTSNANTILGRLPPGNQTVLGHERRGPGVEGLHGLAFSPYTVMDHSGWDPAQRARVCAEAGWPPTPFWWKDRRATVVPGPDPMPVATTLPAVNRPAAAFSPTEWPPAANTALRGVVETLRGAGVRLRTLVQQFRP